MIGVRGGQGQRLYANLPVWGQNLATSAYGAWLHLHRFGPHYAETREEVLQRAHWGRTDILRLQTERLRSLLGHSLRMVPYYRDLAASLSLAPCDFQQASDIQKLPILRRRDATTFRDRLIAEDIENRSSIKLKTSGTTGAALEVILDRSAYREQWATWWRYRSAHGVQRTEWCGYFGGQTVVPLRVNSPPYWRVNYPSRQILYSPMHLSSDALPHYVMDIKRRNIRWLHGYPSIIAILARHILNYGPDLKLNWVTVGGETVFASQKQVIERAFGCRCIQHYGCVEGAANFSECNAGNLHADEDLCAIELLPTGEAGQFAIVGTNLVNFAMPLIRYDTGDVCGPPIQNCSCCKGGLVVARIDGRRDDFIVLADGRLCCTLDEVFVQLSNIHDAQIVQSVPGSVVVRIVPTKQWTKYDERKLLDEIYYRVGELLDVKVQYCNALERTRSGKFRLVDSRCGRVDEEFSILEGISKLHARSE
jgi:phenylacetate-CoA ligase